MPRTTFAGHPLHPQLITAPAALLPFSFVMDLMHVATGRDSYADAAYYAMAGGVAGGLAAGLAGALDYLTIPPESQSKKTANFHALINTGSLGLYGVNLFLRRRDREPGAASILLNALGTAGLVVGQWYGGKLVYQQGMRVEGVDPNDTPELMPPGDKALAEGLDDLEEKLAPVGGPGERPA